MSSGASYEERAAAKAISNGHSDPANLRELLIWTTSTVTGPAVEAYFKDHMRDAALLRELFKIALEGEDAGDAPWAAANLIAEFSPQMLSAHRRELDTLSRFEWDYLRIPALKALAKLPSA